MFGVFGYFSDDFIDAKIISQKSFSSERRFAKHPNNLEQLGNEFLNTWPLVAKYLCAQDFLFQHLKLKVITTSNKQAINSFGYKKWFRCY